MKAADSERFFDVSGGQAEWLRRQLREKHMTDSIYHGVAIGLSLLASSPPDFRVGTLDFGRALAYLARAGWDNDNTFQSQGERYAWFLQDLELIDGNWRLSQTGEQMRAELTLPIHMSLKDLAGQLNPGGVEAAVAEGESEWRERDAAAVAPAVAAAEAPTAPPVSEQDEYEEFGAEPGTPPVAAPQAPPPAPEPVAQAPAPPSPPQVPADLWDTATPDEVTRSYGTVSPDPAAAATGAAPGPAEPQAGAPGAPPAPQAPPEPQAGAPGAPPAPLPWLRTRRSGRPGRRPHQRLRPRRKARRPPRRVLRPAARDPRPGGTRRTGGAARCRRRRRAADRPAAPRGRSRHPPVQDPAAARAVPEGPATSALRAAGAAAQAAAAPGRAHSGFIDLASARAAGEEAGLRLPSSVYAAAVAALATGRHVVLTGPAGSGKTTLALALARAAAAACRASARCWSRPAGAGARTTRWAGWPTRASGRATSSPPRSASAGRCSTNSTARTWTARWARSRRSSAACRRRPDGSEVEPPPNWRVIATAERAPEGSAALRRRFAVSVFRRRTRRTSGG